MTGYEKWEAETDVKGDEDGGLGFVVLYFPDGTQAQCGSILTMVELRKAIRKAYDHAAVVHQQVAKYFVPEEG